MPFEFIAGQVLHIVELDGAAADWRVIVVDEVHARVGMIPVRVRRAMPCWRSMALLESRDEIGCLAATPEGNLMHRAVHADRRTSESDVVFYARCERIASLMTPQNLALLFEAASYTTLVAAAAAKAGVSTETIRKDVYRHLAGGLVLAAQYPTFDRRGGAGDPRESVDRKLGRPSAQRVLGMVSESEDGQNASTEVRAKLERGAKKFFYASRRDREKPPSLRRAYRATLRRYFSEESVSIDEHSRVTVRLIQSAPTLRQFVYHGVEKQRTAATIAQREGRDAMNLKFRAALGKPSLTLRWPAAVFQVDATLVDLHLVAMWSPLVWIGRPWIYCVRDWYSGAIVGFAVSLQAPSFETASVALRNTLRDKVALCLEYDVTIEPEDWPMAVMPDEWLVDRGELLGTQVDQFVLNTGSAVSALPPMRPDWKGLVESTFRCLNADGIAYAPGAIVADYQGRRRMAGEPVHTLRSFTRALITLILTYNRKLLPVESRDPGIDACGEGPLSRTEVWEWGVANRAGRRRSFTDDEIAWRVLPSGTAVVSTSGLRINGLTYQLATDETARPAGSDMWHLRGISRSQRGVTVAFNPANVALAWVIARDGSAAYRLRLTDGCERYAGYSLQEVQYRLMELRALTNLRQPEQLQSEMQRDATLEALEQHATRALAAVVAAGLEAPRVTVREARAHEQALEAFAGSVAVAEPTVHELAEERPKSLAELFVEDPS